MSDFVQPKPIVTNQTMPGCSKEVKRNTTFQWSQMWLPNKTFDKFYCTEGKRDVTLIPHLTPVRNTSIGCDGCPFYTNPERNG